MLDDILCFHYYFPPLKSPAVFRNYNFAKSFSSRFKNVFVLTSDNYKKFPSVFLPLPNNVHVYPISTFDYRTMISTVLKKDAHVEMDKKSSKLFDFVTKMQKSYPFNLVLGEGNLYYINNSITKAIELIRNNNIKVVYSSFAPYADHYIAYNIKSRFPNLKWIADFRDLQVEPLYKNVFWPNYQMKIEKKILQKANKITSISQSYANSFERHQLPCHSVLRGVDIRAAKKKYKKFTISYTGSLYFDYRNPTRLLKVLVNLINNNTIDCQEIELLYAGRDGHQYSKFISQFELNHIFKNLGMLGHQQTMDIQSRSHINVLLTSSSKEIQGILTGKLFEYFEAGNPILCLINGVKDSEIEHLLHELNAGCVVYDPIQTDGNLESFILKQYQLFRENNDRSSTINHKKLREHFSWQAQCDKLLKGILSTYRQ